MARRRGGGIIYLSGLALLLGVGCGGGGTSPCEQACAKIASCSGGSTCSITGSCSGANRQLADCINAAACADIASCLLGATDGGTPAATCALGGTSCATLSCCSGVCSNGNCVCTNMGGNCQQNHDCCSAVCASGLCAACNPASSICHEHANCCSGICQSGICAGSTAQTVCTDLVNAMCDRLYACLTGAALQALQQLYGATAADCKTKLVQQNNCANSQANCPTGTSYDSAAAAAYVDSYRNLTCDQISAGTPPSGCDQAHLCH